MMPDQSATYLGEDLAAAGRYCVHSSTASSYWVGTTCKCGEIWSDLALSCSKQALDNDNDEQMLLDVAIGGLMRIWMQADN